MSEEKEKKDLYLQTGVPRKAVLLILSAICFGEGYIILREWIPVLPLTPGHIILGIGEAFMLCIFMKGMRTQQHPFTLGISLLTILTLAALAFPLIPDHETAGFSTSMLTPICQAAALATQFILGLSIHHTLKGYDLDLGWMMMFFTVMLAVFLLLDYLFGWQWTRIAYGVALFYFYWMISATLVPSIKNTQNNQDNN